MSRFPRMSKNIIIMLKRSGKQLFSVENIIIETIKYTAWGTVSKMSLMHSRTFTSETVKKKKKE